MIPSASLEAIASDVYAQISPAVVGVRAHKTGTGLIIGPDLVIGHAHHLLDDPEPGDLRLVGMWVTITFNDGRVSEGRVIGHDGDLMAVTADTRQAIPPRWPTHDNTARLGQIVCAVGRHPGGGTRLTFGLVSALRCTVQRPSKYVVDDGVEHTAPLGQGEWGAPIIVDSAGDLIGLNMHRRDDGMFNVAVPAGPRLAARLSRFSGLDLIGQAR